MAMKTISVSVDDETRRLARIRAAETGTTVSAMMRDLLVELLQHPADPGPSETEPQRRARLLDEVLEKFSREDMSHQGDYDGIRAIDPFIAAS